MRIVVNTRLLIESRMEGIARYNYESLKRMVLANPQDEFYFLFDRPYSEEFIFAENVTPVKIGPPTRHPILIFIWLEIAVNRILKRLKPDVFLSGDTYLSLRTKTPTLLVSHDIAYAHYPKHIPFFNRKYYQFFFPRFHRKAKKLIAVSEFTKNDLVNKYKLDPDKIRVAHNSANGHFIKLNNDQIRKTKEKLTGGKDYFVYLGSIHPRKNLENLIKAYNYFRNNGDYDHKLLIVGRPAWNTTKYYETLNASPYRNDILTKQFRRKELPLYIGSASGMCYVSLFEGFGIPILEGFEAGIPVITSNVSSMPEVAGDAALLVDPKDPEDIGEAMLRLAADKKLSKELIEKGKLRLKAFNWENTAAIIYEELEKLVLTSNKN